ncbi:MAG: hypothetical protein AB7K24_33385 [Gemmataceae bacterium]
MADDKADLRTGGVRNWLPWLEIFRGFQVALDLKKLLLAGGGILVMALGWWLLAVIFYDAFSHPPTRPTEDQLREARDKTYDETDATRNEQQQIAAEQRLLDDYQIQLRRYELLGATAGKNGLMRTMPWDEERGHNPFLVVTGLAANRGRVSDAIQLHVLLEPFYKFFQPIYYLLHSNAGWLNYIFFTLCFLWTLATWAIFGGALTRMATVQLARKEKISMGEALRFTLQRYMSYFTAPLFPLIFVLVIAVGLILFGILHMIPVLGDILVDGLGWPLVILAGLLMAVILVGLVGWPLMYATISTEGSDSFDALSRSYSYVYQAPWLYLWNVAVALAYGCALVLFVGFMGSFMVYLGKWGMEQTPFMKAADREPDYLFIYAPQSFGWRALLLENARVEGRSLVIDGQIDPVNYVDYVSRLNWWNQAGAYLVGFWLHLVFLMILGFSYSYFWVASTIIYLLMRQRIDDTDLDEVYLEEDEGDEVYSASMPEPAEASGPVGLQMVDAPKLRTPEKPPEPAPTVPPTAESEAEKKPENPPAEGAES